MDNITSGTGTGSSDRAALELAGMPEVFERQDDGQ